MSARWLPLLALGGLWLPAGQAYAWTETRIETVHARVDLEADAGANVVLDIFIYVQAGWLEGFEIAGLGPGIELTDTPVEVLSAPARASDEPERARPPNRFSPDVRLRDDRVSLRFRRRNAPRRGRYRITLRYRTSLAPNVVLSDDGERFRVTWTLPGWRSGLDGVLVEIRAPAGADFAPDDDTLTVVSRSREEHGGRSLLRWRRAHLPRTVPWTVAVEVPRTQMAPLIVARQRAAEPPEVAAEDTSAPPQIRPRGLAPVAGALLVGFLSLLALSLFEREARRRRATPRPWLPLPGTLRKGLVVLCAGSAAILASEAKWAWCFAALGTALLATAQRRARRQLPGLGRWRTVRAEDLEVARRRSRPSPVALSRWGDLTTAAGTATLLLATLALVAVHASDLAAGRDTSMTAWFWALLPVPLMAATRQRLPRTPQARLWATAHLAGRLRGADGYAPALALALHEAADGRWQDARVRLVTEARPRGLLRLDIALDDDDIAYGVLLTREKTEAEAQAARLCSAPSVPGPGGRIARLVPLDEALALALRFRPSPTRPRRGRTPRRPNRHRPRPVAAPLH